MPLAVAWKRGVGRTRGAPDGRNAGPHLPFVRVAFEGSWNATRYREGVTKWTTRDVRGWLNLLARPRTLEQRGALHVVSKVFHEGRMPPDVPIRQLRRCLRGLGLPSPNRWKMARKAVSAVTALQAERCTVAEAAYRGRYSEPRAFRRHCELLFQRPPISLQLWAGWEPLLGRFVAVDGRSRRARGPDG